MDHPVAHHAAGVGDGGAAEPVGEDLIGDAPAKPARGVVGLVDGELKGLQRVVAGVAAPAQEGAGTAGAVEGKGVPHQIRLRGSGIDPAEHGPIPLHTGGGQVDLPGCSGELLKDL